MMNDVLCAVLCCVVWWWCQAITELGNLCFLGGDTVQNWLLEHAFIGLLLVLVRAPLRLLQMVSPHGDTVTLTLEHRTPTYILICVRAVL